MALPTMTRGIQLAFAVNVANTTNAQPSETLAPHRPCPVCAGPTARVGRACRLRAVRLWHQRTPTRPSGAPPPLTLSAREPRGTPGSGRADYDGTMNAGYVFLGLVLVLAVLWVGGYIKVGGVLSLYRRIRLAALLAVVALIAIAATRIFGLA